jgi:hypothetical protein
MLLMPGLTKFKTFILMLIACCSFLYIGYYYSILADKKSLDEKQCKGIMRYSLSSSMPQNVSAEKLIKVGAVCNILFESDKDENRVVQMFVNDKMILSLADTNQHFKNLRNLLFIMGLVFTLWFLSRIYRYQRYGDLTWRDTQQQKNLI